MKRTVLVIAAMLAATGYAAAKAPPASEPHALAACANPLSDQKLDCTPTGSVQLYGNAETTSSTDRKPRLGIDIDPWLVPSFN